jgi:hypothetical protein
MEDAIFSFKVAGFLFFAIVIALCLFGALLRAIPFGTTVVAFGFVLVVLHVILGLYYWIEASHFSEDTQTTLKYIVLGIVFALLLAVVIWAKTADD